MNALSANFAYRPDHATPPGQLIHEYLEQLGISARELARRCGRSGKLMAEIIAGKAPVEPETALQLERVLGLSASIWINLEAEYRLHIAREHENRNLVAWHDWAKSFPLKELAERDLITRDNDPAGQVQEVLRFFGVGSVRACEERIGELVAADFRTSPSYANSLQSLAAWLRIGEREAQKRHISDFNREAFVRTLKEIRALTLRPLDEALPELEEKCAQAGVVFVLEKPFSKVRASGVSRWISPRCALIQQSLRHGSDDHFWFTFFHECAHLLLHSRKAIFIDMAKGAGNAAPKQEEEANDWAADFLIPHTALKRFLREFSEDEGQVAQFAAECRVAPGIVVGRLQHLGVLGFSTMNHLKCRYTWSDGG